MFAGSVPALQVCIINNAVKYVPNVENCDRRIRSAINIQGRKMQYRVKFLLTRAL